MKKRVEIKSRGILIIGIISIIFCLTFVLATHTVLIFDGAPSYNVSEDVSNNYNFTINASAGENITQLNITLPTNFTFTAGSEGTNITTAVAFINTSNVLSWTNLTTPLANGTGTRNNTFWFNATCITPGVYNFTIQTMNSTIGVNLTTFTHYVTINDTTAPTGIIFTSPSATGNTNLSKNFIYINLNVTDNGILDFINVSIYNESSGLIINSSGAQFSPVGNITFTYNFTNLADGNYTLNITTNDTFNKVNITMNKRVVIDTVIPTPVSLGTGCGVDSDNLSQSHIYINITNATETNERNITFNIYYSNGSSANSTVYTLKQRAINVTGLSDGSYTYNVTICDYSNNCNSTATRTIRLDKIAPVITFACNPTTTSKAGLITCSCSALDATSGVSSTSYTTNPDITEYGTFTTTCTTGDYAGNNDTSSIDYTVKGGAASGTGTGGSTTIISWSKTYVPTTEEIKSGYTSELKSNERVKLTVDSKTHYLGVTSLTATSATISVASSPQTATLAIGEEKKFEITDDYFYDLSVKLNSIINDKADITIKNIYEEISEEEVIEEEIPEEEVIEEELKKGKTWLWIVIGVIVVLILIGIVYKYKKK